MRTNYITSAILAVAILVCCAAPSIPQSITIPPAPAPARWRGLIGEYGPDDNVLIIFELDGTLRAHFNTAERERLNEVSRNVFKMASSAPGYDVLTFTRDARGRATQISIDKQVLKRRQIEPESGNQLHVKPLRPVRDLMKEALAAQPPQETGDFLDADLVDSLRHDKQFSRHSFLFPSSRLHATAGRRSRRAGKS